MTVLSQQRASDGDTQELSLFFIWLKCFLTITILLLFNYKSDRNNLNIQTIHMYTNAKKGCPINFHMFSPHIMCM